MTERYIVVGGAGFIGSQVNANAIQALPSYLSLASCCR
jgi:hypothetical protein